VDKGRLALELPEPTERAVVLAPEIEEMSVRGVEMIKGAEKQLTRRLMVCGPVHSRITPSDVEDDSELIRFLRDSREYVFYALRWSCSFRPKDGELFTECLVGIGLRREDKRTDEPPIAWSMQPRRLDKVTHVSSNLAFVAGLKLTPVDISVTRDRGEETEQRDACVQAFGELGSDPSWELYRVKGVPLRGMQDLNLVVRAPAEVPVIGKTTIEAKVRRKTFGVIKYRGIVPGEASALDFRLV
jgi:hypothetical protein